MPDILPNILLTLIICLACCVLISGIIFVIRAVKLAHDERILEAELRAYTQTKKADPRMTQEDTTTEPKTMTHNDT